ncbi:hypothetical protein [Psychrobacillus sp. FSL H8-0510]|uniref:hypothetical protein n=1 Tax=Psychrobacillus sp. FSL H8-0510 TaxID=2921394 RepID=UPI0030FBC81E
MRQINNSSVKEIQPELTTNPGPLVIRTLLLNSKSNIFEDAKQEWELVTHISNDTEDFVENCELCNHKNYKENWLIQNQHTQALLKVGSDCIRRFIQLAGTSSQADSNTFFDNKQKEISVEIELRVLYKEVIVLPLPTARRANRFKKLLLDLIEKRGQLQLIGRIEGRTEILHTLLKVPHPTPKELNNFQSLLNTPSTLPVIRENKKFKEYKVKEGSTFKKSSKVTNVSLAYSNAYQDPEKKYD